MIYPVVPTGHSGLKAYCSQWGSSPTNESRIRLKKAKGTLAA